MNKKKIILFYAIVFLVFLGISNGLLSILDPEAVMVRGDDPESVYSFYPEMHAAAVSQEYRVNVDTDNLGLRSCPSLPADPGGIYITGDSFTEGWGIPCQDSYPFLLQRAGIGVFNAGIHGGTPSFFILRNRHYMRSVHPSRILVQLFDNDLDDLDKFEPFVRHDSAGRITQAAPAGLLFLPAGAVTRWIKESALYRTLRRVAGLFTGNRIPIKYYRPDRMPGLEILTHQGAIKEFGDLHPLDLSKDYGGQFEFYRYLSESEMDGKWKSRFQRMRIYLNQMADECNGIPLEILYIPAKEVFAPGGIAGKIKQSDGRPVRADVRTLRGSNPFYQLLEEFCGERHCVLHDGQEIFYRDPASLYFPGDAHLNPEGHRVLAEYLFGKWAPSVRH